jgi:hypothetical protein
MPPGYLAAAELRAARLSTFNIRARNALPLPFWASRLN